MPQITLGTLFTADVRQVLQGIRQINMYLSQLNSSFKQTGQAANQMGTGVAAAVKKTTAAMNQQTAAISKQKQELTGLAAYWQRVQQAMKTSLAYGTAGAAIYGIIDGLKSAITTIADYDQALKNLQAITGATDSEMVGLADTIKDVSSKYVFSTKEVADGMVLMGQAGFTATQTMQAMDAAAKLAMGTMESLELTVDLLTTTIVSFNMSTVESGKVADIMANAMNRSKLTLDKLRVSFNYVGNAAYEAGISLEETAAAMAIMSNAGMRASTIGTAFRQVIQSLIAPNRRVREAFQGMGIDISQLDPKMVGFTEVVQNLSKILIDQNTGMVNMGKAYELFGLRAAQAAAILARSADNEYPRMLAMMYEVGSASTMADKQMEGLVARFKNVAANAQLIAIAIGEGGLIRVLRMLADALVVTTKALKDFFQSDLGQITTSFLAWTAASSAFIAVASKLVDLLKLKLIPAILSFGAGLLSLGKTIAWMAAHGQGLAAMFQVIVTSMGGWGVVILAVGAALGALITVWQRMRDAQERAIEGSVRTANGYRTAADTLESYQKVLENLSKKQMQGRDISTEYNATIQRLTKDMPMLKGVIDANVSALDKNIGKMEELRQASLEAYISEQIKQIGMLRDTLNNTSAFDRFTTGVKEAFGQLESSGDSANQLEQDLVQLANAEDNTAKSTEELVASFANLGKKNEDVTAATEKSVKTMEQLDSRLVNVAKAMQSKGEGIDNIIAKMKELGATEAQIKTVTAAIKKWGDEVSKEAGQIEAAMANLPHKFVQFFETLDAGSKVAFAKAVKSMEAEVSQYKKTADAILKTETDRYAAEAFIRTKHLMKFADDVLKEKMTAEQLLKFKKALIEEEIKLTEERIAKEAKAAKEVYDYEMKAAGENQKRKEEAQRKYNKTMEDLAKQSAQIRTAIDQGANNEIVESFKKTTEEVVKTGKKMVGDYINELQRVADKANDMVKQLLKGKTKAEEDVEEKIRGVKQKTMTESQKWDDDEREASRLLGLARTATYSKNYDDAKEYYKRSADLASGLAREVKGKNDEVLKSEQSAQSTALSYLNQIKAETSALYDKQIAEEKEKAKEAEAMMTTLNDLLKEYGTEWDKLSNEKVRNFINAINDAIKRVEVLTGKSSEMGSDWANAVEKFNKAPKPQEPTLGAKTGLGAVQKPAEGGGTITVDGKTYQVGGKEQNELTVGGKRVPLEGERGGTITMDGKTFDVGKLADYSSKVEALSQQMQDKVKEQQTTVVTGVETSGQEAVTKIGEIGTTVGTAISTASETAKSGMAGMAEVTTKANEGLGGLQALLAQTTTQSEALNLSLTSVLETLIGVKDTVIEIVNNTIKEFFTDSAMNQLDIADRTIKEIKSNWDSLQSKEIVLTVTQVNGAVSGGGGGGSGGGGWGGTNGGAEDTNPEPGFVEWRYGGLIQALRLKMGGWADNVHKFARGFKLPGYGGGDKVKALLEPGEYVVRKEQTAKYLPLIQAINNDTVADMGKRFGGMIRAITPRMPVPAYASGGEVMGVGGSSQSRPIIIKIKPTYMSGDRTSVQRLAKDLQRELELLKVGRGYSNG